MSRSRLRSLAALSLALAMLAPDETARAHTGYPPIPIFTFTTHPDFPMEDFVAGHLGIILPTYDPRFLYAAYRNLIGAPFAAPEVLTMKRGWEPLLNNRSKYQQSWKEKWLYLRIRPGKDQGALNYLEQQLYAPSYLHTNGQYLFFENCADDAYRNAFLTFKNRQRTFGKNSPYVQAWLAAQDEVFANCGSLPAKSESHIVGPVAAVSPRLVRQDRAYQIAAAYFYRGEYEEARSRFAAIADDPTSTWRGIAPYLVGRCLLRKAQFDAPKGQQFDVKSLEAAAAAFRSVIADESRREWHEPAANLLEFIEIRQNPQASCSRLAVNLTKRGSVTRTSQPLTDYLYLLNEDREDTSLPSKVCKATDDLSDWLKTFSGSSTENFPHAYEQWHKTNSSPWLLAALAEASPSDAHCEELLRAAASVPHTSPAYWSAVFYRERLLTQKGRLDLARNELDGALAHADGLANPLNASSKNLLLALRARVASDLGDFLRFAVRTPSTLVYMDEYNTKLTDDDKDPRDAYMRQAYSAPHFDDDAGAVINNYLSLSQLLAVAQSNSLPLNVRRDVALMAFTRAILTENTALAEQIAHAAIPIAPDAAEDLNAFLAAPTQQRKDFAVVWLLLHHPEMQPILETASTRATPPGEIDSFQDNWWVHFRFDHITNADPEALYWWDSFPDHLKPVFPEETIPRPAFASALSLSAARNDWKKLERIPPASDWLASRALAFARTYPEDSRIPEALHLAVRATRFGSYYEPHDPNYSKQAFQLLHKKYPDSEWTKKTPYWF